MMTKLPKTFEAGDIDYRVIRNRKRIKFRGSVTDGFFDADKKAIFVYYKLPFRLTWVTFAHEWLHAVAFEHGFELPHSMIEKLECPIADLLIASLPVAPAVRKQDRRAKARPVSRARSQKPK